MSSSSSSFEKKKSSIVCRTNTECSPSHDKTPPKSPTTHRKKKKQKMTIKSKGKTPEINRIAKTEIDIHQQMQHCKTEECQDVLKATWNKDSNNATSTNWTATVTKRENYNSFNKSESSQQPRMITKEQYERHNKQSSLMQWDVNQDEEAELVQSFEGIIGYQKSQQQSQLFPSLRRSQLESAAIRSQNGSAGQYAEANTLPKRKQQSSHAESEFSRSAQTNTLKKLGILFDAIEQNHASKQQTQQQTKDSIYASKQMNPWLGSTQQNYNSMNMETQNAHNNINSNNSSAISSPVFNPKMVLPIGRVLNQFNQVSSAKSKKVPMIRVENTTNQNDIHYNVQKTDIIRVLQPSASASTLSFSTMLVKSPTLALSAVLEGVRIENPFSNQQSDKHRLYQKNQSCQSLVALLSEKYKFAIASIQQQYEVMGNPPQEAVQNAQIPPQSTRSKTNSPLHIDTYRKKGFFYLQKLQAMREESLKKSAASLGKQENINRRLLFPTQPNSNNNGASNQANKSQEAVTLTSQAQPRQQQQQLISTNEQIYQQTKKYELHSQSDHKQTKGFTALKDDTDPACFLDIKGSVQDKQYLQRSQIAASGAVQKVNGIEKQISSSKNNLTLRIQTEPNMYENNKNSKHNNNNNNANSAQQPTRTQQQQSAQKEKIVKANADFSSGTSDKDFQFDSPVPYNNSKFKQVINVSSSSNNGSSRSPSRRQSKSIYETNLATKDSSQEKTNASGQKKLNKKSESTKDNTSTQSSNNPLLHVLLTSKTLAQSNQPATNSNNCRNIPDEISQQKFNKRLLLLKPLQLDGIAVNSIETCMQSDRYQHVHPNPLNSDRDLTVKRTYSTHITSTTSKISKMPSEFVNSFLARYAQSHSSPQPANAVTKMSGQICKTIQRQLNWYGS